MLFIILITVFAQQQIFNFDAQVQAPDSWIVKGANTNPPISICNAQTLLGGHITFQIGSALMRNFELPPHYQLYIDFQLFRIDSWNSDQFQILLDGREIFISDFQSGSSQALWWNLDNDEVNTIQIEVAHNSNFASIQKTGIYIDGDTNESWGISVFTLSIYPCPDGCDYCDSSSCQQWELYFWDKLTTNYILFPLPYFESYDIPIYRTYFCDQLCQYIQHLPEHNQVMMRFRILIEIGKSLDYQIIINHQVYYTNSSFAYLQFDSLYEIFVPAFYHSSYLINIQIQRIGGTQTNFYIKDFQLFVHLNTQTIDTPSSNCINKFDNICLECQIGWNLDQSTQICLPICGDLIISGNEECEDANVIPYDGCHNCQFQCNEYCSECRFWICISCNVGFTLINNNCEPICGDNILVPYLESCDDGNEIQGDGCYNCKFECIEHCDICNQAICIKCQIGYKFYQNQCLPVCGDQIVISEYEDCDDGNNEPFDGCFECKFQCNLDCQTCEQGSCLECIAGLILINQICESFCGNSIATGSEDCDDGNIIEFDGCHLCLFSCTQFCENCQNGICYECQEGYLFTSGKCINECSDGHVSDYEQCDDGNQMINDGCFKCQIQENWICDDSNPSECTFELYPNGVLKYLNQTYSTQYVELSFTQEVRNIAQQRYFMVTQILNAEKYQILSYPSEDLPNDLSMAQYILEIQIDQLMTEKPLLQITFSDSIINQFDINLQKKTQQLFLNQPQNLNTEQQKAAQLMLSVNSNVILTLGGLSLITFILGDSSFIQEILSLLQYLSYLKFINLEYPENLYIFFSISDLISISPILSLLNLDEYFNFSSDLRVDGKFALYKQEADLISNLTCQLLQGIGLVLLYISLRFLKKLIFGNHQLTYLVTKCVERFNISQYMQYRFQKIIITLFNKNFISFKTLLLLNSWDLLFKTFLYIHSMQQNNFRDYFSLFLTLTILGSYIVISISSLNEIIYLNNTQTKLKIINLIRQAIFQLSLVYFQFNQVLQTFIITINSLVYLLIIQYSRKFKIEVQLSEKISEAAIVLFTLSCVVYFEDFSQYISYEYKIYIGFAQIGNLSFVFVVQLAKFFIQKGKVFYKYIHSKLAPRKLPQLKITADHSLFQ